MLNEKQKRTKILNRLFFTYEDIITCYRTCDFASAKYNKGCKDTLKEWIKIFGIEVTEEQEKIFKMYEEKIAELECYYEEE